MMIDLERSASPVDPALHGFRRLLISSDARREMHGEALFERFARAGLPTHERTRDDTVAAEGLLDQPGTLAVMVKPETGWITVAEHGLLATRKGERYLNPIAGCRSSCTYCYLRARPRGLRPLRVYVGVDALLDATDSEVRAAAGGSRLFCTGELADSLSESDIYPIGAILANHFGRYQRARLELRTKSDRIDALLGADHQGRTTVAFSMSPQANVDAHEPGTASLADRLAAAVRCQRAGYAVAFKFEPIIVSAGWQILYGEMFERIGSRVDVSRIEHVSVGCLRWSEQLMKVPTFARRYAAEIRNGAWIEYRPGMFNGTVDYAERLATYEWIRGRIRGCGISGPIWWSLEQPELIAEMKRRDNGCRV